MRVEETEELLSILEKTVAELDISNTQLRAENEELRDELDHCEVCASEYPLYFNCLLLIGSQSFVERQEEIIQELNDSRRPFRQPANEILLMIFHRTVAPSYLLDTASSGKPNSAWFYSVSRNVSLALVCKRWYQIASELLYEQVALHEIGQLCLLARTLECNGSLGVLIKRIHIHFAIPRAHQPLIDEELRTVVDRAPHLNHFALHAFSLSPSDFPRVQVESQQLDSISNMSSQLLTAVFLTIPDLTTLICGSVVRCTDMIAFLKGNKQLQSLAFHLPPMSITDDVLFPEETSSDIAIDLSLESLVSLRVITGFRRRMSLGDIGRHWKLPSLRNFSIDEYSHPLENHMDYCDGFLRAHGKTIHYLHIRRLRPCSISVDVQAIISRCPNLDHISLGATTMPTRPFSHRNIRFVDLWSPASEAELQHLTDIRQWVTQPSFPRLTCVRELDRGLPAGIEWPMILPPDPEMEDLEFEYPGLHLKYGAGGVHKIDTEDWLDSDADSESTDETYCYQEESESDTSDDGTDYLGEANELESVSRDTVLSTYFQTSIS